MNKYKNKKILNNKTFKIILILFNVFSFLELSSLIILICTLLILPLPERFIYSQLDPIAIQHGEGTSLILIYVFGIMLGLLVIINLVMNSILYFNLIYINNNYWILFFKLNLKNKNHYKFITQLVLISFMILSSLLPFLLGWIYTFLFYKYKLYVNFNNKNPYSKFNYIFNILNATITPIISFFILVLSVVLSLFKGSPTYVNTQDINSFFTLSNNKPNTVMLYLDRGQGLMWNTLLCVDFILNKNNSFINQFPEFTTFLKSVSLSQVTNGGNPPIASGLYYSVFTKELNIQNAIVSKPLNEMTIRYFYGEAFYNQAKMFKENNVDNILISSIPYISYHEAGNDGKAIILEKAYQAAGVNYSLTTNEAIATTVGYDNKNRTSNAVALKNAPDLYNFINTTSKVYQGFYMHHTHENYAWYDYETKKYYSSGRSDINYIKSMWFSLLAFKDLLNRFKSEPFYNEAGEQIGNVYDYTQFCITSDHGYNLTENPTLINDLSNWVATKMNVNPLLYANNQNTAFNSMLMYKPILGKKENFTFDTQHLISQSDIPLIFESGLKYFDNRLNPDYIQTASYFKPNYNGEYSNYFQNGIVIDPLNNLDLLNERYLITCYNEWPYEPFSKKYNIFESFKVETTNTESVGNFFRKQWESYK